MCARACITAVLLRLPTKEAIGCNKQSSTFPITFSSTAILQTLCRLHLMFLKNQQHNQSLSWRPKVDSLHNHLKTVKKIYVRAPVDSCPNVDYTPIPSVVVTRINKGSLLYYYTCVLKTRLFYHTILKSLLCRSLMSFIRRSDLK